MQRGQEGENSLGQRVEATRERWKRQGKGGNDRGKGGNDRGKGGNGRGKGEMTGGKVEMAGGRGK